MKITLADWPSCVVRVPSMLLVSYAVVNSWLPWVFNSSMRVREFSVFNNMY
jgi:hypothetical protein